MFDATAEQESAGQGAISGPVVCAPSESRPPLSDRAVPFLEVDREGEAAPSGRFGRGGAKPTNAWWTTMTINKELGVMSNFMTQMPYILGPAERGVHVMQPFMTSPGMEEFQHGLGVFLGYDGQEDVLSGPVAENWDEACVTMAYRKGSGVSAKAVTFPACRGSAFITAEFRSVRPVVSSDLMLAEPKKLLVDGKQVDCSDFVHGKEIEFTLSTGDSWLVVFPPGMGWVCKAWPFRLLAAKPTPPKGAAVQLAMLKGKNPGLDVQRWHSLVRQHAGAYPVASGVNFKVGLNADDAEVSFNWADYVRTVPGYLEKDAVLQLLWPVHVPLLDEEVRDTLDSATQTPFRDLRGLPKPLVVRKPVVLHFELYPLNPAAEFGGRTPLPTSGILREALEEALMGGGERMAGSKFDGEKPDSEFELPENVKLGVGDTYFSGKLAARMARLVTIAAEMGKSDEDFVKRMLDDLQTTCEAWLTKSGSTPFIYDRSWGGLVSCGCTYDDCWNSCAPHCSNDASKPSTCPALRNVGYNFGNGYYNDHHFHYGYWIYTTAVLAKFRPEWEKKWREPVLALIRDYANPSSADKKFPIVRHKDWFLCFSWAGGIKFEPLGRNQESVSEAINSYYALAVYGTVLANRGDEASQMGIQLRQLGRLLMAMEVHGGDTYWHVRPDSKFYPNFQHPTVGIMWEHVCLHQTWFGGKGWAVEGIQMLPVVPALEDFLNEEWVMQHFLSYKESCESDPGCKKLGWSWLVCMQQAVVNVSDAFQCLHRLDDETFSMRNAAAGGNSLTNSLVWLATRPGKKDVIPWPRIAQRQVATTTPEPALPHLLPTVAPLKKFGRHGVRMNNGCFAGESVVCPNIPNSYCLGDECCPDQSLCPSAPYYSNKICKHPKKVACRGTDGDNPAEEKEKEEEKEQPKGQCKPGSTVRCPNSEDFCKESQCCPDGSLCPSAPNSGSKCQKPKAHDCTGLNAPKPLKLPEFCEVGESVPCPNSNLHCAGSLCCPDGSPCPSAPNTAVCWKKEKVGDCTVQAPVEPPKLEHKEPKFKDFGPWESASDDQEPSGEAAEKDLDGAEDGDDLEHEQVEQEEVTDEDDEEEQVEEEPTPDESEEEDEEAHGPASTGCDPENKCLAGSSVKCPDGKAVCSGISCCPDGSLCPSAPLLAPGTSGCPHPKKLDCTCMEAPKIVGKATCSVGASVPCPGHEHVMCAGLDCCPDGSTCPSAWVGTTHCQKAKVHDCTGQTLETEMKAEKPMVFLKRFNHEVSDAKVAWLWTVPTAACALLLLAACSVVAQARRFKPAPHVQVDDSSSSEGTGLLFAGRHSAS